MKIVLIANCVGILCLAACSNTLQCERHFIPANYIGKVVIYFDQKNGQKQYDENGCVVYQISNTGECFSKLPFKSGTTYPNDTFRFYERVNQDSVLQIPEFWEKEYLEDTITNRRKKYIFYLSSGYSAPNHVFEYEVDYGANYKKHLYY